LCQGTQRLEPFTAERAQHRAIERAEGLRFAFAGSGDALFGALLERSSRQRAPRQPVGIAAEQALEPGYGFGASLAFVSGQRLGEPQRSRTDTVDFREPRDQ